MMLCSRRIGLFFGFGTDLATYLQFPFAAVLLFRSGLDRTDAITRV